MQLFIDKQKEFHKAVTLFNAWYACLIRIRNATKQKTGVHLQDKLPNNFIKFSLQSISKHYDINDIKKNFPNALEVSEEDLNAKLNEFNDCKSYQVFRGKYE